jgi:hypothetical protein
MLWSSCSGRVESRVEGREDVVEVLQGRGYCPLYDYISSVIPSADSDHNRNMLHTCHNIKPREGSTTVLQSNRQRSRR